MFVAQDMPKEHGWRWPSCNSSNQMQSMDLVLVVEGIKLIKPQDGQLKLWKLWPWRFQCVLRYYCKLERFGTWGWWTSGSTRCERSCTLDLTDFYSPFQKTRETSARRSCGNEEWRGELLLPRQGVWRSVNSFFLVWTWSKTIRLFQYMGVRREWVFNRMPVLESREILLWKFCVGESTTLHYTVDCRCVRM